MAVEGLTITAERAGVVDFSYPFWFEPAGALINVRFMSRRQYLYSLRCLLVLLNQIVQSQKCKSINKRFVISWIYMSA